MYNMAAGMQVLGKTYELLISSKSFCLWRTEEEKESLSIFEESINDLKRHWNVLRLRMKKFKTCLRETAPRHILP